MKRAWILVLLLPLLLRWTDVNAAQDVYLRSERLGITHVALTGEGTGAERFANALALGAGWDRWPIYWDQVERQPGEFVWDAYDRAVTGDLEHGLQINAILLGRPPFYQDGGRIAGMHQPIFSDHTDTPGEGKTLNPENHWAVFVQQAVERYRPGGVFAREQGGNDGEGIRVWEIWNEPDFSLFWGSSIGDYARLLKIAYLVIKWVDPEMQVMFGGLLFGTPDNWLARVLAVYENDPFHEQYNWYMDMVALHNYSYPWRTGWLVNWVDQTLKAYKLDLPIWVNESGVPVWDDYPGPIWALAPEARQLRATQNQQAEFFIQSSAYAWAEGADVVFFHQLYDDCGNQPAGTDFPVSRSPICFFDTCSGDAYGLFRNPSSALCFSHHPRPGTPRPAAESYRLVAEVFGGGSLDNPQVQTVDDRVTVISFDRPETHQRIYAVWNTRLEPVTLRLPAGGDATARTITETWTLAVDDDGVLDIALQPARCDYFPFLNTVDITAIGGQTVIISAPLVDSLESPTIAERPATRARCPRLSG